MVYYIQNILELGLKSFELTILLFIDYCNFILFHVVNNENIIGLQSFDL